jgi:hypothetical protein
MGFALVTAVGWGLNWPVPKYLLTELPLGPGRRSGRSLFHVRFGSGADIARHQANVRFAPESGHRATRPACPLCAISGHNAVQQINTRLSSIFAVSG